MEDSDDNFIETQLYNWDLDKYIDEFKSHGITNKHELLKVNPDVIRSIFFDSCAELNFWRRWAQLNVSNTNTLPQEHDDKDTSSKNIAAIRASLHKEITKEKLMEIFQRHHITRSVLKSYKRTNNLEYGTIIVEVIVSDLIDIYPQYWNNEHYETIADNITAIFKSEIKETYYIAPVKNKSAIGKVPDRFRNYIQKCRDISGETKKRGKIGQANATNSKRPRPNDHSINQSIGWLKIDNESLDEIKHHWQNTFEYRMLWMQKNPMKSPQIVFQEWPILKSQNAPELIFQDFDQMTHLNVRGSIWNWSLFIEHLRGMKKCSNSDILGRRLLEISEYESTTEGGKILLELVHLLHLFPLKGNFDIINKFKKQTGNNELSSAEKSDQGKGGGIQLSRDCIILNAMTIAEMKEIKNRKMENSDRSCIEPYIVGVGGKGLEGATEFFVILDDQEYQMKSALEAIDLCFKIFHVMHAEYSLATVHIWQLIERGVYKFHSRTKKIPNMEKFYKVLEEKDYIESHLIKNEVVYL